MSSINAFGFAAVVTMLLAYGLEERHRFWTLVFAIGCVASAIYAYLIGSYPFALAEAVWTLIALHKWRKRKP